MGLFFARKCSRAASASSQTSEAKGHHFWWQALVTQTHCRAYVPNFKQHRCRLCYRYRSSRTVQAFGMLRGIRFPMLMRFSMEKPREE